MQVAQFNPTPALREVVQDYLIVGSGATAAYSRLLPAPAFALAFRISGKVSYDTGQALPSIVVSAIADTAALLRYSENSGTLIVRFKVGGAQAVIRHELHQLAGTKLSLDDILHPGTVRDVEERFALAVTNKERIAVIESFLMAQLKPLSTDLLVQQSIQEITASKGIIKISNLIRQLHTSGDPFEKRFRRRIGTTPKHFASIIRLQSLITMYPTCSSLTELAYAGGYFDQSHFIKDFRSLTGLSPKAYFASTSRW